LLALVIEPVLFLLADRHPRAWFVRGGTFAMALAAIGAALAPGVHSFAVAAAVGAVASGCAVATAQATLIDAYPDDRERMMTRWTMWGMAGDLAAPGLIAALGAASIGWRGAYLVVGVLIFAWAIGLTRTRFVTPPSVAAKAEEEHAPLLGSLWLALRNRRLLAWLFGASLCDLLDEILVVFASLHLRDELGAGQTTRAALLGGFVVGAALGLVITDRLLRRMDPLRLLAMSGVACGARYLAWIVAPTLWLSAALLVAVGATAAPLYPITMAQAFAALPGRSGAVQAASHLFTPLSMSLPLLIGWTADRHGTGPALIALAAEPVGLAILALVATRAARSPASSRVDRAGG
jgi:MFS family permease